MNFATKLMALLFTAGAMALTGCSATITRDDDGPYRRGYYYRQNDGWRHRYEPYSYRQHRDYYYRDRDRDRSRLEVHVGD